MSHLKLFIPGPTEVRPEILQAQTAPMIGHRSGDCDALIASVEGKLRQLFMTESRVYILASSGSGLQEAAIRNGVRDGHRVANFVNGAFAQRWHEVSAGCGKQAVKFDVPWGQPVLPETVDAALAGGEWDAITVVHNETSTGTTSPVGEIAALLREKYPDTLLFVDAVSSLAGDWIPVDEWGLDICLTSSQKALALPPGLAFAAVSDRVLERAKQVTGRGWYFDFLVLEKYLTKNTTPATPAISLLRAADLQLDCILAEGLEARVERPPPAGRFDPPVGAGPRLRPVLRRGISLEHRHVRREHAGHRLRRPEQVPQAARPGHLQRLRRSERQDLPHRAHGGCDGGGAGRAARRDE